MGITAVLAIYGLLLWGIFVPAPLGILFTASPGNYASGTVVGGITWEPSFFPVEIRLDNETGLDYTNLNAYVQTSGIINKIGLAGGINHCTARPKLPGIEIAGAAISYRDKAGNIRSIPIFRDNQTITANVYQIQCDKLAAKSRITVTLAAVLPANGTLAWAALSANYNAGNRGREEFSARCFLTECRPDMPRSSGSLPIK